MTTTNTRTTATDLLCVQGSLFAFSWGSLERVPHFQTIMQAGRVVLPDPNGDGDLELI